MKYSSSKLPALLCAFASTLFSSTSHLASAQSASPTLVSVNSQSNGGANSSAGYDYSSSSRDGRYVVFQCGANNITTGKTVDASGATIFIRDLQSGITKPVDVTYNGVKPNGGGAHPSVSADGRYVAFTSTASNLVPNDGNNSPDIFVRDMNLGTTRNVCFNFEGYQLNAASTEPFLSGDGKWVVFASTATNWQKDSAGNYFDDNRGCDDTFKCSTSGGPLSVLDTWVDQYGHTRQASSQCLPTSVSYDGGSVTMSTEGYLGVKDTNGRWDVYLSSPGGLQLVSKNLSGADSAAGVSVKGAVSDDGRFVVFHSDSNNLGYYPSSSNFQVFLRDLSIQTTYLVSQSTTGSSANNMSSMPKISGDGRYIVFYSRASNLVASDNNNQGDLFVFDNQSKSMKRIYIGLLGDEYYGDPMSSAPNISADGSIIIFTSTGTDLTPLSTNGSEQEFSVPRP